MRYVNTSGVDSVPCNARARVALLVACIVASTHILFAATSLDVPLVFAVNSARQVYGTEVPVVLGLAIMNTGSCPLYVPQPEGVSIQVWDAVSGHRIAGDPQPTPKPPDPTHYYEVEGERVLMNPIVRLAAGDGLILVIHDALARCRGRLEPGTYRVGLLGGTMAVYEEREIVRRDDVDHPLWVKAGPVKSRLRYVCNTITLRITGDAPAPAKTTQAGSPHSESTGSFWEAAGVAAAFVVLAVDETGNRDILMALGDSPVPENSTFRCSEAFAEQAFPTPGRFLVPVSRHGNQFEPVSKEPYGVPRLHEMREDEVKEELYYYQEALREWQSLTTTEAKVAFLRKLLANSILQELHEETAKELARLLPPGEASASADNIEAWIDLLSNRKISRGAKRVLLRSFLTGRSTENQPETHRDIEAKQKVRRETPW